MSSEELKAYRRKADAHVVAVQLDLDTEGFTYVKWGGVQTCKPRDWVVNNDGDTYTVDREVFRRTYEQIRPGLFRKTSRVWARVVEEDGKIQTREGVTEYEAGDYLVFNDPDESDGWAMSPGKFQELYEADDT